MIYFFVWWLIIELIGWLALPLAMRVLKFLPDQGYTASKALGLLIASYALWLGASTRFLNNDLGGIIFALLALAGLSAWQLQKSSSHNSWKFSLRPIGEFVSKNKRLVITVEILFLLAFAVWTLLRAYAPYKIMQTGGEKFMEIAFLNAILNSKQFPPLDPWLSGFSISYYYFGYVMMAMITRLSGAPAGIGFELYDALLFALTLCGAFGVVYNLVAASQWKRVETAQSEHRQPVGSGLLGALFVAILGNWEGLLEALYSKRALPESFWRWINIPDLLNAPATGSWYPGTTGGFWWWRASRVIQDLNLDYQPIPVSPISEFPIFSFLLGDNHPHVMALPFVLLAIGLTFNLFLGLRRYAGTNHPAGDLQGQRSDEPKEKTSPLSWRERASRWNPAAFGWRTSDDSPGASDWVFFLSSALTLGGLAFLNTWDLPIYMGLFLLAYGTALFLKERRLSQFLLQRVAASGAGLLVTSIGMYIFFYLSFGSQAAGILPYIFPPTRLAQYLLIFGPFIIILSSFLVIRLLASKPDQREVKERLTTTVRAWGIIVLACLGVYGFLLLGAVLTILGGRGDLSTLDPVIQTALGNRTVAGVLGAILSDRLRNPWLFLSLTALLALTIGNLLHHSPAKSNGLTKKGKQVESLPGLSDEFVFLLVFTGILLTLTTELFYLRDSFGYRMNTIFKFYYQAWVMLGCASAYGMAWLFEPGNGSLPVWLRRSLQALSVVAIGAGMVYPIMAFYSRANAFQSTPNLDGASEFANYNPEDWAAIQWLQQNAAAGRGGFNWAGSHPPAVILEAPGTSYSYEGRISAFSGVPAVLGWAIHESQWRGNYDEQGKREPDIITIFTTSDVNLTLELLRKWQVTYVILGQAEYSYIQRQCQDASRRCNLSTVLRKFDQALQPVFTEGRTIIYQVP